MPLSHNAVPVISESKAAGVLGFGEQALAIAVRQELERGFEQGVPTKKRRL